MPRLDARIDLLFNAPLLRSVLATRPVGRIRVGAALLAALLLTLPTVVDASPTSLDDPLPRPRAVQGRKYPLAGKNDIGILGSFHMNPNLTTHYGAALNYARYFNEYFALDVLLGGGYGGVSNLGSTIRNEVNSKNSLLPNVDDLQDAGALLGFGQVGLRFSPLYGKVNLASELPIHLSLYFVGGAGAAFVSYESMQACQAAPVNNACEAGFASRQEPTLAFSAGVGLRVFLGNFALRAEVRDIIFPDSYKVGVDQTDPVNKPGKDAPNAGFTHAPLVFLGGSFAF